MCACTATPASSARPRRSRARTPTARPRPRSSTPSEDSSTRRSTDVDPLRIELVAERCAAIAGNYVARGAVDLAVWDLVGQILGCPCHTLLGGFADDVAAAHMVSLGEPAEMAGEAVEINERLGVSTFKVKVGRAPDLDIAAVRAVRDALPDADLYVDANRGWSYEDAVRAGDALIELGVRAIEEPISVEDRAGRLRLAERWAVPLAGDESCISLAHVDRALEEGAVRVVSIKTARTGSPSRAGSSTSASRATSRSWSAASTRGRSAPLATIAFAAAFAATAGQPAEVTNFLDLADDLVVAAPEIRDGRAAVPAAPGLGRRGRRGAPAALPGGRLMLFMAEMEVRLPPDMPAEQADELKAREREYSQAAPARRALAAPVAGGRPLRERQRPRRRLGRRAARAALRPPALPLLRHPRHSAGAPPQRHRPRRDPMSDRANLLISDILRRIHEAIVEHDISYEEYQAAKQWLIDVGEAGEWPLFGDVYIEHVVEEQAFGNRAGSQGTILGPFHLPDAPLLDAPFELPQRPDEPGDPPTSPAA